MPEVDLKTMRPLRLLESTLQKANREGKAYLTVFVCSLTYAVHLELLPSLETEKFIPCLKQLVAASPRRINLGNRRTFAKAGKWLRSVRRNKKFQGYLEEQEIKWQFNLSQAPWWGEWALYKTIGAATLTWAELSEVLLDVEMQIKGCPLNYVEDDVKLPTLTPSMFLFQRSNFLPEQAPWRGGDGT